MQEDLGEIQNELDMLQMHLYLNPPIVIHNSEAPWGTHYDLGFLFLFLLFWSYEVGLTLLSFLDQPRSAKCLAWSIMLYKASHNELY